MFYDRYEALCKEHGKKPYTVAREIGLGSSNVAQWKKGSTPRPEVLEKLADYFGITTSVLLGGEQKEKPTAKSSELSEIEFIFSQLTPSRQTKLLELARLYLDDQRRTEENQ